MSEKDEKSNNTNPLNSRGIRAGGADLPLPLRRRGREWLARSLHDNKTGFAAICVFVAVLLYSAGPLAFDYADAGQNPFAFSGWFFAINALCYLGYLAFRLRSWAAWAGAMAPIHAKKKWFSLSLFLAITGLFQWVIFSLALKYVNVAIASVLFELWVVLTILMTAVVNRDMTSITKGKILLILFCLPALALVFVSEKGVSSTFSGWGMGQLNPIIGSAIALAGAVVASLTLPFYKKWSRSIGDEFQYTMIGYTVGYAIAALICFGLSSVFESDPVFSLEQKATIVLIGASIGMGTLLWRYANSITTNAGVNAIFYLNPVLAFLWLIVFNAVDDVARVDLLIIGAVGIVAINPLIYYEAEIRRGYIALILCLWLFGAAVYVRDGVDYDNYYNALIVGATMFILLLSFRTDRLIRRTNDEEESAIYIWRHIARVVPSNFKAQAYTALKLIDECVSHEKLHQGYRDLLKLLPKNTADDMDFVCRVEILVHSKQQGRNFGELVALVLMSITVVLLMIFYIPSGVKGSAGFFSEFMAVILSSTVAFLMFNISDLWRDRRNSVADEGVHSSPDAEFTLKIRDVKARPNERRISLLICAGMILTYGLLLWCKWNGHDGELECSANFVSCRICSFL